jgi:uncharacterized membrane protein (UPF0127 family)
MIAAVCIEQVLLRMIRARGDPGAGGSRKSIERGACGAKTPSPFDLASASERRRVSRRSGAAYLLLVLVAGCTTRAPARGPSVEVTFAGAPALSVEVASTPQQRQRGLMDRKELPAGTGMLFLFPGSSIGGFWMKNTLVPLSIAYVDGDRVVSTAEMVPCPPATARCPTYAAARPYTAAVEAPAGFFPAHGVGKGTRMELTGPLPAPQ